MTAYRAPLRWDFRRKNRCNSKFRTCYRNNPCLSRFSCSLLPIVPLFSKWCHDTDEGNLNDSFIRSFFKMLMSRNSFIQVYTKNRSYTKGGLKHSKAPKARADLGFWSSQQDDLKWWLQVINHIKKSTPNNNKKKRPAKPMVRLNSISGHWLTHNENPLRERFSPGTGFASPSPAVPKQNSNTALRGRGRSDPGGARRRPAGLTRVRRAGIRQGRREDGTNAGSGGHTSPWGTRRPGRAGGPAGSRAARSLTHSPVLALGFVDVPVGAPAHLAALVLEKVLHPLAFPGQLHLEVIVHLGRPPRPAAAAAAPGSRAPPRRTHRAAAAAAAEGEGGPRAAPRNIQRRGCSLRSEPQPRRSLLPSLRPAPAAAPPPVLGRALGAAPARAAANGRRKPRAPPRPRAAHHVEGAVPACLAGAAARREV